MTGPYDAPTTPTMSHPLINEAFGWDTSSDVPPSVVLGVGQAQDTLANLRASINQHVTEAWANAAVNTDMLQGKVAYNIAGQLAGVQQTATALQQPIAMSVLAPLSQAVEQGVTVGAVPPMPGAEPSTPPCVQIMQGGLAGDIGPAIEAYRVMAFAQRFTRGTQYNDAVQFIRNCLPADGPSREMFAAAVLKLQNQPDTVSYTTSDNQPVPLQNFQQPGAGQGACTPDALAKGLRPIPPGQEGLHGSYSPAQLAQAGLCDQYAGSVAAAQPATVPVVQPSAPGPLASGLTTWDSVLAAFQSGNWPPRTA